MKRFHLVLLPCILVVVFAGLLPQSTLAQRISPASCGSWSVVSSPNPKHKIQYVDLTSIAAISANDVWTVGSTFLPGGKGSYTTYGVIEHWNGTAWSIISDASPKNSALIGVAAVATNDVWAVGVSGYYGSSKVFIEHWNGTAWSVITSPQPVDSTLNAVSALSSTDVWAVGFTGTETLSMHWDGTAWSVISGPSVAEAELNAVTAISPTDVWTAGNIYNSSVDLSLIEHWDGNNWQVVASPTVADSSLLGIAAVSPQMMWAVGSIVTPDYNQIRTLIENWNGTEWTVVPSPDPNGLQSQLIAVSAVSASNAWAVGYSLTNNQNNDYTLIVHWDGTAWSVVPSPDPSSVSNRLFGVTGVPGTTPTQFWAAGFYTNDNNSNDKTLTEFYC